MCQIGVKESTKNVWNGRNDKGTARPRFIAAELVQFTTDCYSMANMAKSCIHFREKKKKTSRGKKKRITLDIKSPPVWLLA